MDHKFVKEIIKTFARIGHVEYRFMKDRIDICKNNNVIATVKDDCLYLANKDEKLIRIADASKGICTNSNEKMIITYDFKCNVAML